MDEKQKKLMAFERRLQEKLHTPKDQRKPRPKPTPSEVIQTATIRQTKAKNKKEIQEYTIDYVQQNKINLAKSVCIEHDVIKRMFLTEKEPFIIRLMKQLPDEEVEKFARIFIYLGKKRVDVATQNPIKWQIFWKHNTMFPSFITYSGECYTHDNKTSRLIEIDTEQLKNFGLKTDHFMYIFDKICKANLGAGGRWLINQSDVKVLHGITQDFADEIKKHIPYSNIWYTGKGFRLEIRAGSVDELKDLFKEWKDNDMVDIATTSHYAQKIFSVQTFRPHFQTEISPYADFIRFRHSNPAFFYHPFNDDSIQLCKDYYKSHLVSSYRFENMEELYNLKWFEKIKDNLDEFDGSDYGEWLKQIDSEYDDKKVKQILLENYNVMESRQIELEGQIRGLLI